MTLSSPQLRRTLTVATQCLCARDQRAVLGAILASSSAAPHATWQHHEAKKAPIVAKLRARIVRQLRYAKSEVLRNLEHDKHTAHEAALQSGEWRVESGKTADFPLPTSHFPLVCGAAAADIMFDPHKFGTSLTAALRSAIADAVQTAGNQALDEFGDPEDDVFSLPSKELHKFLDNRANKLSDVPDEIFDQVKRHIDQGFNAGETHAQLAQRVREAFGEIEDGRAERIAQTETGCAYGFSRHAAMKQTGVKYKKWLTSGLDNVRATHAEANGQIVPIDQPFQIGTAELDYPGDPDCDDASEVINCHCVSVAAEADGDETDGDDDQEDSE